MGVYESPAEADAKSIASPDLVKLCPVAVIEKSRGVHDKLSYSIVVSNTQPLGGSSVGRHSATDKDVCNGHYDFSGGTP